MKNINESELFNDQINSLEEELQELLDRAEKLLGYKTEDINQVVEDLLSLNTNQADALASDIMDIEEDMVITEEYYTEIDSDDPFTSLYDQDSDPDI